MCKYTIFYLYIIQTYIKHIYNPFFMRLASKNLTGYKYHHLGIPPWKNFQVRQVDHQMSRAKNMLQHSMEPLEVCQVIHDVKPSHKDHEDGNFCCFKELNSNFYIDADGTSGGLFYMFFFFASCIWCFFLVHLWDIKGNQSWPLWSVYWDCGPLLLSSFASTKTSTKLIYLESSWYLELTPTI